MGSSREGGKICLNGISWSEDSSPFIGELCFHLSFFFPYCNDMSLLGIDCCIRVACSFIWIFKASWVVIFNGTKEKYLLAYWVIA